MLGLYFTSLRQVPDLILQRIYEVKVFGIFNGALVYLAFRRA